jgi:hypothetical protein
MKLFREWLLPLSRLLLIIIWIFLITFNAKTVSAQSCRGELTCCSEALTSQCPVSCGINPVTGLCNCAEVTVCPGSQFPASCLYFGENCSVHSSSCENPMSGNCYEVPDCPNQGEYYCPGCGGCVNTGGLGCNEYERNGCGGTTTPQPTPQPSPGCSETCNGLCGQWNGCNAYCSNADGAIPNTPIISAPTDGNMAVTFNANNIVKIQWDTNTVLATDRYRIEVYETASLPKDRSQTGFAISAGDRSTTFPKEQAFDDNNGTLWKSTQRGAAVNGAAYIGQKFGNARAIKTISIRQSNDEQERVSLVQVQYKTNDSTPWTFAANITLENDNAIHFKRLPTNLGAHERWRLVATSGVSGATQSWGVKEIGMYEEADAELPVIKTDIPGRTESNYNLDLKNNLTDLPSTYGLYTVRVQAENTGCSTVATSSWSTPVTFQVVDTIEGKVYNDVSGQAVVVGGKCSLTPSNLANPVGASVTIKRGSGAQYVVPISGSSFSTPVPYERIGANTNTYTIGLQPGSDGSGNINNCSCPSLDGVSGTCLWKADNLTATDQNFYVRPTILSNSGWWQVSGGNIYAGAESSGVIRSYVPINTCPSAAGCISAVLAAFNQTNPSTNNTSGIAVTGAATAIDTTSEAGTSTAYLSQRAPTPAYAQGTKTIAPLETYEYFYRLFGLGTSPTDDFTTLGINSNDATKPSGKTIFYRSGDLVISQPWIVGANEKIIVVVDGNLTFTNPGNSTPNDTLTSVAEGGFLAFIVKKDIVVDGYVGNDTLTSTTPNLTGVFIADGTFAVMSRASAGITTGDARFIGAGVFAGWGRVASGSHIPAGNQSGIRLERDFSAAADPMRKAENNDKPVELFITRPDLIRNIPEQMTQPRYVWQETN